MITPYQKLQEEIEHAYRRSDEDVKETLDTFNKSIKEGIHAVIYDMKWRINETFEKQQLETLWNEAYLIISNTEFNEIENIDELKNHIKQVQKRYYNDRLMNLQVNGHGIEKLTEHTSKGNFLKEIDSMMNRYENEV